MTQKEEDETKNEGWKKVQIKDIAAEGEYTLVGGPFGSKLGTDDYVEEGVPVIRGSNLSSNGLRFSTHEFEYVTDEKADDLSSHLAYPGDVVFTQRGTLGQVGLIPEDSEFDRYVLSQSQMKLTVDQEKADEEYIYYYFSAPTTIKRVENHSISSGVPHINLEILRNFRIEIPPLDVQENVSEFMSSLDDLIANNKRRIEILEEMARLIYREWFVNFNFPGSEDVEMKDSELGPIPENFKAVKLDDVCELTLGTSPKSEYYNEDGDGLPFHQGVSDFGDIFPDETRYCSKLKRVAEKGDILFSVRAPVGRMNLADQHMVIGRGLHAIRSIEGYQEFIFEQMKYKFPEDNVMGSGTVFNSVTKKIMLGLDLIYPSRDLLMKFTSIARPVYRLIENLTQQNKVLRGTRDLLLPRLISGEIEV